MNRKQRIVVILTLAVIVVMCLVPPWVGRSSIENPVISYMLGELGLNPHWLWDDYGHINAVRLAVQCVIALAIGGGLLVVFSRPKTRE